MKNAFAKLLEKNPVESSHIAFRAGGNGVPILTRASASSTTGYQTNGLPTGSRPSPGGGANQTTLGAIRMGDQDGNAPGSAIIPDDIFYPPGQPDRFYPERTFANVGNNVYQPQNDDKATLALLRRLGDQQFKAVAMAPFEDYRAKERLANDLMEASRNASISELGLSRAIIRNLAAERRQQSENDYLRKMLDAGATPEAAKKEIEDVRNANAIQEARKVDDRQYQAKMLIQRVAMRRGVTPMVQEPLNQSSAIDNPQRSQAMSEAMGMPGEGFGTSPLDMNRQFLTPDFYRKYLRRSNVNQENADEQAAFSNLLTSGEIQAPSGYSMATMRGQERQQQIELASEGLASRLETIRARVNRIMLPLPENVIAKDLLDAVYTSKGKKKNNRAMTTLETIQDLRPLQLLIALNIATLTNRPNELQKIVSEYSFGTPANPSSDLITNLKDIVTRLNGNEPNIRIPFVSVVGSVSNSKLVDILQSIKNNNTGTLAKEIKKASDDYFREVDATEIPFMSEEVMAIKRRTSNRNVELPDSEMLPPVGSQTATQAIAERPIPGSSGQEAEEESYYMNMGLSNLTISQLKDRLKSLGLPVSGNKMDLIMRLSSNKQA